MYVKRVHRVELGDLGYLDCKEAALSAPIYLL